MSKRQRPHVNDLQQQGFRTTAQAAQEKALRKFYAQKVTRRELAEFEQAMRNAFGTILAVSNWIIDNAGLREKYDAAVAAEKATQEAAVGQPAPEADPQPTEVNPVEAA
jgi:hypothetical protein